MCLVRKRVTSGQIPGQDNRYKSTLTRMKRFTLPAGAVRSTCVDSHVPFDS